MFKRTKLRKEGIADVLQEYVVLRDNKKTIETRMKQLADEIKEYCTQYGTQDSNGSFYSENDSYAFGKQAKKKVTLDEENLIAYLKEKGITAPIKQKQYIDTEVLDKVLDNPDSGLSESEIEPFIKITTSYAVDIKVKEEMPEVEETQVALAADKKRKLFGGKKK